MAPEPSIIARKLQRARHEGMPQKRERAALGALRLGLARAADQEVGLALAVIGATQDRLAVADLGAILKSDHLLILLDGGDGRVGLVALSAGVCVALVQAQTVGRVDLSQIGARVFSATDVALATPFVDATLTEAERLCLLVQDRACLAGYHCLRRCPDLRAAALTLDQDRYRVFSLTLDVASGVAQGDLHLILPEPSDPIQSQPDLGAGARLLGDAMQAVHADLDAVLCRVSVPLSELQQKQAGDVLVLPILPRKLTETELWTITGQMLTTGQLGQSAGLRALKLSAALLSEPVPFERAAPPARGDAADHPDDGLPAAPTAPAPLPNSPSDPPTTLEEEITALAGLDSAS